MGLRGTRREHEFISGSHGSRRLSLINVQNSGQDEKRALYIQVTRVNCPLDCY